MTAPNIGIPGIIVPDEPVGSRGVMLFFKQTAEGLQIDFSIEGDTPETPQNAHPNDIAHVLAWFVQQYPRQVMAMAAMTLAALREGADAANADAAVEQALKKVSLDAAAAEPEAPAIVLPLEKKVRETPGG